MKTNFLNAVITAATVLFVCSCNKQTSPSAGPQIPVAQAELNLSVITNSTKTTQRSDENDKAINSISILIFNSHGDVENLYFGTVDSQGKVDTTIRTSMGVKTVWAFANASDNFKDKLMALTDLESMKSLTSELKEDNTCSSFFMVGKKANVDINAASVDIDIQISRIVARVEIHKITHNISAESDFVTAQRRFVISSIYLINAVGEYSFGEDEPTIWCNQLGCYDAEFSLFADLNFDAVLEYGQSYETPHYLYAYPNPYDNFGCVDETWCARPTRLVVECWVGEEGIEDICYYSFEMPNGKDPKIQALSANKTYSITSFTITRFGSETPYDDIPVGSASITISVKDWETGESYEYTI